MRINAVEMNKILKTNGYTLMMDKIHAESELKVFEKIEENFDRNEYLTIKDNNSIVIGRIYSINSFKKLDLSSIELTEREIDIILAFFKFFEIPNAEKVTKTISKEFKINLKEINVDIIRNNVFKQQAN